MGLSKVEWHEKYWLKRNDLSEYGGCFGGKAECAYKLITKAPVKKFVTCGSRDSLQCDIVSEMCENMGYECHVFIPLGKPTPTTERLESRKKTVVHKIDKGYTVVIKCRAKQFADENQMTYIPFGMECAEAIEVIARQVQNIPKGTGRIVVPVGGGITFCGILKGLRDMNRFDLPVLGVMSGKIPNECLWRVFGQGMKYTLIPYVADTPPLKMYSMKTNYQIDGVKLDPIYEGKCYPYLLENDLLWIVGCHEV